MGRSPLLAFSILSIVILFGAGCVAEGQDNSTVIAADDSPRPTPTASAGERQCRLSGGLFDIAYGSDSAGEADVRGIAYRDGLVEVQIRAPAPVDWDDVARLYDLDMIDRSTTVAMAWAPLETLCDLSLDRRISRVEPVSRPMVPRGHRLRTPRLNGR